MRAPALHRPARVVARRAAHRIAARGIVLASLALIILASISLPSDASAQEVKVRDLTVMEGSIPVRLMGYGLVVGLGGTGDRVTSGVSSRQTVQSVANLLRRFGVEVPPEYLRTRNVAAVLVTAELSSFLRPGGRFDVHVASVGDARSLRGGVLWMTPLVADVGGTALASAQGPLVLSEKSDFRWRVNEATARIPAGGVLEQALPRPRFASTTRLMLRDPELETATRIAAAINDSLGAGTARVEDPGSVLLTLDTAHARTMQLARIGELRVHPNREAMLVIDTHDGTIVAGGGLTVGEATVTHDGITLTIGANQPALPPPDSAVELPTEVRVRPGASVQEVASALRALQTPAADVASIFEALRTLGAISAQVVVR